MHDITTLVAVNDGRTTTTSLKVAEVFGKQHKHVLEAIRNLECSDKFNRSNFRPVDYTDAKGENRPMYLMTRDGFTLLVMGFTGEKAMQFKETYIEAFNAMETAIREARRGMISEEYAASRSEALIRENERLRYEVSFSRHFLPQGNPGDLNKNGNPKIRYRRGYYTSGNGKSVMALVERYDQPGLFDEVELQSVS